MPTSIVESSSHAASSSNSLGNGHSSQAKRRRRLEDLSFSSPGVAFLGTPTSSDAGDEDSDNGVRRKPSRLRGIIHSHTSSASDLGDSAPKPPTALEGISSERRLQTTKLISNGPALSSLPYRSMTTPTSIFRNFSRPEVLRDGKKPTMQKGRRSDEVLKMKRPRVAGHSQEGKAEGLLGASGRGNGGGPSAAGPSAPLSHAGTEPRRPPVREKRSSSRAARDYDDICPVTPRRPRSASSAQRSIARGEVLTPEGQLLASKKQALDQIYKEHDGLVRELFHLNKFVTYFGFDPDIAAQDRSDVFERFRMEYDLPTRLSSASGRTTRRIVSAKRGDLDLREAAAKKASAGLTTVEANGHHPSQKQNRKVKETSEEPTAPKRGPGRPRKLIIAISSSDDDSSDGDDGSNKKKRTIVPAKRRRERIPSETHASSSSSEEVTLPPKRKVGRPRKRPVSLEYIPRAPVVMERVEGVPRMRAMQPLHLPLPPRWGSLSEYLKSWLTTGDFVGGGSGEMEMIDAATLHQRERRAASLYDAIDNARREGILQDGKGIHLYGKTSEVPRSSTLWDSTLQSVIAESSRRRHEARNKVAACKRVARLVHLYWDEKLGRGDKQRKEEQRRIRALAKFTTREVRKQWKLAVNVVKARRALRDKDERDRLGREQLKSILEQSTHILDQQHRTLVQGEATSDRSESDIETETETEDSSVESFTEEDASEGEASDQLVDEVGTNAVISGDKRISEHPSSTMEEVEPLTVEGEVEHAPSANLSETHAEEQLGEADLTPSKTTTGFDKPDVVPKIRPPFLLRGTLRPYQQIGFEWLASLYNNGSNGILADEMGLGKTIQTTSLLAHLACDKGEWGPHLVVAPTSVMLNWEVEFKKFLPGFKILSYYGSQKERKEKRRGWNSDNPFNVCITSYQLVLADQHILRRKAWHYLILDEAHHIKNFKSQRWQTLLGFNSKRRLLLTGTPLQNNLMDLWSLMYFLMPNGVTSADGVVNSGFASMKEFQQWFSNPLGKAVESAGMEGEDGEVDDETKGMVSKLHTLLRPYLLRRMKSEVEKELPNKYEHIIKCRLSKRQTFLYNDFMSRAKTRESLASGNYLSIINCLMQLRKVCNHPDLFEQRPIVTSFAAPRSVVADYEIKDLLVRRDLLQRRDEEQVNLAVINLQFNTASQRSLTPIISRSLQRLDASSGISIATPPEPGPIDTWSIEGYKASMARQQAVAKAAHWKHVAYLNHLRCQARPPPLIDDSSITLIKRATDQRHFLPLAEAEKDRRGFLYRCDSLNRAVLSYDERRESSQGVIDRYAFVTPRAVTNDITRWALPGLDYLNVPRTMLSPSFDTLHKPAVKLQIAFPDASLLQYDCGKLQELALLMRRCKEGGHRILIFTQMTKILDILETWLSYNGFKYLRLDGSTKVEDRQALTERFNRDDRITAFILSTRSGGLGINLTGADMVLFWDLDWNFQIEAQCMDRAHRIGQTRDVHIYRFVSQHTIEENMLKKSNEKRMLDNMVIQNGQFTTEGLSKMSWIESMFDEGGQTIAGVRVGSAKGSLEVSSDRRIETAMDQVEDEEDAQAAKQARLELHLLDNDFHDEMNVDKPSFEPPVKPSATISEDREVQQPRQSNKADAIKGEEERKGGEEEEEEAEEEEEEEEEEAGTVDDYMLRRVDADWEYFVNL